MALTKTKSEFAVLEDTLRVLEALQKREQDRHMMDQHLLMFEDNIQEAIDALSFIVNWEPSDDDIYNHTRG